MLNKIFEFDKNRSNKINLDFYLLQETFRVPFKQGFPNFFLNGSL